VFSVFSVVKFLSVIDSRIVILKINSVFLSGASSGIGLATAKKLDMMGWRVFAAFLPGDDTSALTQDASERLIPLPLDITDAAAVQSAAEHIRQITGTDGLQGIINCAGISIPGAIETLSIEAIKRQFEVNLFGHIQVIQALVPLLRASGGGRIVNVGSVMGKVAMPVFGAYSMSKHALEALSDVLRMELAQWHIHVSIIEPGAVATPMTTGMESLVEKSRAAAPEPLRTLYAKMYDGIKNGLRTQANSALPAELIADCIIHALTAKNPKTRYAPGVAVRGLLLMRRFAPDKLGDAILKRALGLGKM
jgi:NAD(P)-dependent dehydrogenase (short-subunit alcohol dehydrogenase family)